MITCAVFGWFALYPYEYKNLLKLIAGGAGFVSNFMLWKESGYFDVGAETKPMLHLWSLGIEEQFYLVWPFALWFAWKSRLNLLLVTVDSIDQAQVENKGDLGHAAFFERIKQKYSPCSPSALLQEAPTVRDMNELPRCFQSHKNDAQKIAIIGDSHGEHLFPGADGRFT